MRFWPPAALLLAGTAAGAATPACEIYAYVGDSDPAGPNVRAAPTPGAAVLKRLPHRAKDDVEDIAPELEITRFQNGWAQVRDVFFGDYGSGRDQPLFKGPGWISGKLLSATLNRIELRSAPRDDAPVVARLLGDDWGPDSVLVTAIEDCLGTYAKIRGRLPNGNEVSGWADGLCSNQVTTCP